MFPYHKPFMLWTRDIVVKRLKTFQSDYIKLALNFVVRLYYQCISYSITVNQLKQPNTWNYPIHTSIFFSIIFTMYSFYMNSVRQGDAYMLHWTGSSLVHVIACCLFGTESLPEQVMTFCQMDPWDKVQRDFLSKLKHLHWQNCIWKCRLSKWRSSCPDSTVLFKIFRDSNQRCHLGIEAVDNFDGIIRFSLICVHTAVISNIFLMWLPIRVMNYVLANLSFFMMTSPNGKIFLVNGPLWGEVVGDSPHKGQWRGALVFYLICAWTNGWVNDRDTGDLRPHRTHYDANVAW